jgi:hypothetical protein
VCSKGEDGMKNITSLTFFFVCLSTGVFAHSCEVVSENCNALLENYDLPVEKIEDEYSAVMHDIFTQARKAIAEKENIMNLEWLGYKNKENFMLIRNIMSDIAVMSSFTPSAQDIIRKRLEDNLRAKIREEIDNVLEVNGVTVEAIDDFFDLAGIVCGISQGIDCPGIITAIKNENTKILKQLAIREAADKKMQEHMRKKAKTDYVHNLREYIIMGVQSKKIIGK